MINTLYISSFNRIACFVAFSILCVRSKRTWLELALSDGIVYEITSQGKEARRASRRLESSGEKRPYLSLQEDNIFTAGEDKNWLKLEEMD